MIEEIITPLGVVALPAMSPDSGKSGNGPRQRQKAYAGAARSVVDEASKLGMSVSDIPSTVQDAVLALVEEVDRLRGEVEQARHFEAFLGAEADQHPLLPVFSRRAFQRELMRLFDASEREGLSASVACIHIGGLERLRLQHGLAARDSVLLRCVEAIRAELRQIDLLGYFDGGDFAIALAVADNDGAEGKLHQIASLLESQAFAWNEHTFYANVRLGVVHFRPGLTAPDALALCDAQVVRFRQ